MCNGQFRFPLAEGALRQPLSQLNQALTRNRHVRAIGFRKPLESADPEDERIPLPEEESPVVPRRDQDDEEKPEEKGDSEDHTDEFRDVDYLTDEYRQRQEAADAGSNAEPGDYWVLTKDVLIRCHVKPRCSAVRAECL